MTVYRVLAYSPPLHDIESVCHLLTSRFRVVSKGRSRKSAHRCFKRLAIRNDVFGGSNPYSTISLRDAFGPHSTLKNPPAKAETLRVAGVFWTDSEELPDAIREGCRRRNRFGLIAYVDDAGSSARWARFLAEADPRVFLEAKAHPTLKVGFDAGCWWFQDGAAWIYVPLGPADRRDLQRGVSYRVRARNSTAGFTWDLEQRVTRR